MNYRVVACVSLSLFASAIAACPEGMISAAARAHVVAVSTSLAAVRLAPSNKEANAASNKAFELLLKDDTPAGDEALAALAGHYLGDSTEPECAILERGERMLPWLKRFELTPPHIDLALAPDHSRATLIAQVQSGARCE